MKKSFLPVVVFFLLVSCGETSSDNEDNSITDVQSDSVDFTEEVEVAEPMIYERIDGPANVRETPDGEILFSVEDHVLVECSERVDSGWYFIGLILDVDKSEVKNETIKKGQKIYVDGKLVLTAARDIPAMLMSYNEDEPTWAIWLEGYTFKNNIKPESIPERELEKILNANDQLSKSRFDAYFTNFQFRNENFNIEGYENTDQYMIYGSFIDDPSPIDRLRLVFQEDELLAIVHERPLAVEGKKSYPIMRGLEVTVMKNWSTEEAERFVMAMEQCYVGID
ncbi:MAG: hypothetical protein HUJ25_16370 [Crocinitomicaceae bacterium]|nr:hypothetical protein [Crocinitomicaceae bacterium]